MVLLHGVLMNGTLWDTVVGGLRDRYRCIVPELPFGAHPTPMPDDADLSLPALATMIAEFLTELDLRHVTLVCNDWGGAQLVISPGGTDRVANLVLVSYEAFDNYPFGSPWRSRESEPAAIRSQAEPTRSMLVQPADGSMQVIEAIKELQSIRRHDRLVPRRSLAAEVDHKAPHSADVAVGGVGLDQPARSVEFVAAGTSGRIPDSNGGSDNTKRQSRVRPAVSGSTPLSRHRWHRYRLSP